MTALVWDEVGERYYQTGVDRGVLYLQDGTVAPWNGLIGVEEAPNGEMKEFYLDGVKFLQKLTPEDFLGKLKAFTYPDEFEKVNGIADVPTEGLNFHGQPSKSFNLSYRTKIGNDVDGIDHGYKIHILFNLIAKPDSYGFQTESDSGVQPIEFSWSLTGIPVGIDKIRPTVHISVDSTKADPEKFEILEGMLYGTNDAEPIFPTILQIAMIFGFLGALTIVDNEDGTWTATDIGDDFIKTYIEMIDPTEFEIDHADVVILDGDSYTISSTASQWEGE